MNSSELTANHSQPLVSIVTVVFNDRAELECLIDNLSPFRSEKVELVIIDGGSKDGSAELLASRTASLDYWISERDSGIYDAMNKGIRAARGAYILHVNAGDRLLTLPLEPLQTLAEQQVDAVCCRTLEDGNHLYIPRNDWLMRYDNTWHHQSTFYRRASHKGYDTAYRVFGDFEHNQRMRRAGCSVAILDTVIATHETNGASSGRPARREIYRSIRANFGPVHLVPAFVRFQLLRLRAHIRRLLATSR